jgi:tRNA A37 threonylcarbamoyladenosine modification protein TsaB
LILFSSALELELNNINTMNNLIIDAAADKIFLSLIIDKNIYTCSHENSKSNFEKLIILITDFLNKNKISINEIGKIYVNRGPGSFAGIRNSFSIVKGLFLTKKIDYYCFSFLDFDKSNNIKYEDVPILCDKFKIKKNLIKPLYLSKNKLC